MIEFIEYGIIEEFGQEPKKLYARVDEDGLIRYTCVEEDAQYQAWLNPKENGTISQDNYLKNRGHNDR